MMFTARIRNEIVRLVAISGFMIRINKGYVSGGKALQTEARRRAGGIGRRIVAIKPPIKGSWRWRENARKEKEKAIQEK
jgi:hypothetical protein